MRHPRYTVLVATSVLLGACSKGEPQQHAADSVATVPPAAPLPATPPPAVPPPPPTTVPAVAPHADSAAHPKPKAGTTHEGVKSIGALKYVDIVEGTGEVAQPGMQAMVLYTGKLLNGTTFDATKDRDKPFVFEIGAGQVIQGWDMGIKGMKVGGKRHLIIPPELGYGAESSDPIPPNSTLLFDVELVGVKH